MKKKFLSLTAAILCAMFTLPVISQDLIILRSGDEIQALVNEIGLDHIKYRRIDNPNGPLYNIEKSTVFMIKYANGSKDVFNEVVVNPGQTQIPQSPETTQDKIEKPVEVIPVPLEYRFGIRRNNSRLSDPEIRTIFEAYPEPLEYYNQGQGLIVAGSILQYSVLGVLIYTAIKGRPLDPPESEQLAKKGLIIGGSLAVGWLTLSNIGSLKHRKAVDTYNATIAKPSAAYLNLIIQDTGIGLALRF